MKDRINGGSFAQLAAALKGAGRQFPSLAFYALLMSGLTALLYFPVLRFYGITFDVFYGKAAFDPADVAANLDLLGTLAYLLPSFFLYMLAMAAFWVSWVARHGVRKSELRAGLTAGAVARRAFVAWAKILGAIGWWGILVLPTVFILAFLLGSAGELNMTAEIVIYVVTLAIGFMTIFPVGVAIAATARGTKLSAFKAFGRLKGRRITGALATAILFLIPALIRTELGIWFIDSGWLGEMNLTGTLIFLLIATFTESLVMLIWMTFSDRLCDDVTI